LQLTQSRERTLGNRNTLFRRTERGIPEVEAEQTLNRRNGKPKRQRIKATFYLEPEDILAIDQLQTDSFRESGKKPERSELVSQAIQTLFSKHRNGAKD
jgi:hypothetical protein